MEFYLVSDDLIRVDGVVKELMSNGIYKVEIQNGHIVMAHIRGKMRMFNIRIMVGDKVTLEMSPYDLSKGRIVFRNK